MLPKQTTLKGFLFLKDNKKMNKMTCPNVFVSGNNIRILQSNIFLIRRIALGQLTHPYAYEAVTFGNKIIYSKHILEGIFLRYD